MQGWVDGWVSREGSVSRALEMLQELLHPRCPWICTHLLLLLGDHTAGTKPALSCWAEAAGAEPHRQHPEGPTCVPMSPLAPVGAGSAGYSHHAREAAGAAGGEDGADAAPRDGLPLVAEAAGAGDAIWEGRGQTHGLGETPAAAQGFAIPCHIPWQNPLRDPAIPRCDADPPQTLPKATRAGLGLPREDRARLDSPR